MPDWLDIRRQRTDLTDWVIHWTRGQAIEGEQLSAADVLKRIVADGYLKPTYGVRETISGNRNRTISGSYSAVCYTEQPLDAFIRSCEALPSRYHRFGVAVHKWHLYTYGGRPVIYGDEDLLSALPGDDKYRWVRYAPVPSHEFNRYPVDWTHEREWRSRVREATDEKLGTAPVEGVPLLLPAVEYPLRRDKVLTLPRFIVPSVQDQTDLREYIATLPKYEGANGFLRDYFANLSLCGIVPLDIVKESAEADSSYCRLETIPLSKIDPSVTLPPPESFM